MVKKIFLSLFIATIILAGSGVAIIYFYQDRIIQMMVGEFNKYLNAKVSVEKINLNLWETFPEVSLHFYKTKISSSLPGDPNLLADIQDIYFGFNVQDAINGTVLIKDFRMENGYIDMRVTEYGAVNYNIFKTDSSSEEKVKIDLKEVLLKKIDFQYYNEEIQQKYDLYAEWSKAKINFKEEKFVADWNGEYLIEVIQVGNNKYFKQKSISLESKLQVDTKAKTFTILPSTLKLGQAKFTTQAVWNFSDQPTINLELTGQNTNIQTLLTLLPKNITKELAKYKSTGEVYFKGNISGSIASHHTPGIDVRFGCNNASFYHPDYKKQISNANFKGSYYTSDGQSRLELSDVTCNLDGSKLSGYFMMENFSDPFVELKIETAADIQSLLTFYPVKEIKECNGNIEFKIDFKGRVSELKSINLNKNIEVSGKVKIQGLNAKLTNYPLPFENVNAEFKFENNKIDIDEFSGKVGNSEGKIKGVISNLIPFLTDSAQHLQTKAKIQTNQLDLNQLFPPTNKINNGLSFSPRLDLDLECSIQDLRFKKIKAKNLISKFTLVDKKLTVKKLNADAFGGQVKLEGTCTDTLRNRFVLDLSASTKGTSIDSIFIEMENFSQTFIKSENIKGQIHTEFDGSFMTDHYFSIIPETFKGELKTEIKNGELVSFEPMKKLSKYVDEKELENIRFSNLQNTLTIEKKVVTIPKMEIKSNLNTIWIEGTHTFDGVVDYKVKISLKNRKKKDKDAAFGAIEEDTKGNLNLYLTMRGPSNNIKIAYDTKSVSKVIKESFSKEKDELRNALTGEKTNQKENPKELDEEKYLDIQ